MDNILKHDPVLLPVKENEGEIFNWLYRIGMRETKMILQYSKLMDIIESGNWDTYRQGVTNGIFALPRLKNRRDS